MYPPARHIDQTAEALKCGSAVATSTGLISRGRCARKRGKCPGGLEATESRPGFAPAPTTGPAPRGLDGGERVASRNRSQIRERSSAGRLKAFVGRARARSAARQMSRRITGFIASIRELADTYQPALAQRRHPRPRVPASTARGSPWWPTRCAAWPSKVRRPREAGDLVQDIHTQVGEVVEQIAAGRSTSAT